MKDKNRKGKFLHILGIVMQTIGYLLLIGVASAFFGDGASTDWSGIGIGLVGLAALIVVGTILTKKN